MLSYELIGLVKSTLRKDKRGINKIVILFIIIILAIPGILIFQLNTSVEMNSEPGISFPAIEVTLLDLSSGDELLIKHVVGDPVNWSEFKIFISNKTDDTSAKMIDLGPLDKLDQGETSIINSSIDGFNEINFQKGSVYYMQISHIEESDVVAKRNNLYCE